MARESAAVGVVKKKQRRRFELAGDASRTHATDGVDMHAGGEEAAKKKLGGKKGPVLCGRAALAFTSKTTWLMCRRKREGHQAGQLIIKACKRPGKGGRANSSHRA